MSRNELALIVAVVITVAAFIASVTGVIDVVWQIGFTILAVVIQKVIRSA